ncbi:hypothetical protein B0H19DRAFT_885043, partial [Mycena capillaripes]
ENMAEEVWNCVEMYGLEEKVHTFVMDNASNNDTLMENIAIKCAAAEISFDATDARIRCMPHTAHLAAIKLLEAIGAISKSTRKKAEGKLAAYQDAVTAPIAREHDD